MKKELIEATKTYRKTYLEEVQPMLAKKLEDEGRVLLYASEFGSQLHNLESPNTKDYDVIGLYLPNKQEMVLGEIARDKMLEYEIDGITYDIHLQDIRTNHKAFLKGTIRNIEILMAERKHMEGVLYVNETYKEELEELLGEKAVEYAKTNNNVHRTLWYTAQGLMHQLKKRLNKMQSAGEDLSTENPSTSPKKLSLLLRDVLIYKRYAENNGQKLGEWEKETYELLMELRTVDQSTNTTLKYLAEDPRVQKLVAVVENKEGVNLALTESDKKGYEEENERRVEVLHQMLLK